MELFIVGIFLYFGKENVTDSSKQLIFVGGRQSLLHMEYGKSLQFLRLGAAILICRKAACIEYFWHLVEPKEAYSLKVILREKMDLSRYRDIRR